MDATAFDCQALIAPPKTIERSIAMLCTVLSYDQQGWIISLTPEQAQALCDSELSAQIEAALLLNGQNRELINDCGTTDLKCASRRILLTLWVHLKVNAI